MNQSPLTKAHKLAKTTVALAPMDGVTTPSFRRIFRKLYPDLVLYSEFTHTSRIVKGDLKRVIDDQSSGPYYIQLFGNNPSEFEAAVRILSSYNISGIDINMGCPAKKITNSQHGAALLNEPSLAAEIISASKSASSLPISVKTRLGWQNSDNLITFVQGLIKAGLDSITIHGRSYAQKFKGDANWADIYLLKKEVNIPVIGNGDLQNLEDGYSQLKNLDGFMIGRAALTNPFCFFENQAELSLEFIVRVMLLHLQYDLATKGEMRAVLEFRKFIKGYLGATAGSTDIMKSLLKITTYHDFYLALLSHLTENNTSAESDEINLDHFKLLADHNNLVPLNLSAQSKFKITATN